jgi:hypothetical protein
VEVQWPGRAHSVKVKTVHWADDRLKKYQGAVAKQNEAMDALIKK